MNLVHVSFFFEMGQQQSFGIQQENIGDLQEFITNKAFEEMKVDTSFRHLTISEKQLIDKTILRVMQTHRRIETKLLAEGLYNENILDSLKW